MEDIRIALLQILPEPALQKNLDKGIEYCKKAKAADRQTGRNGSGITHELHLAYCSRQPSCCTVSGERDRATTRYDPDPNRGLQGGSMPIETRLKNFTIRPATEADVGLILQFIRELADYEKLLHEVVASEAVLRQSLFGERSAAEVILGYWGDQPVAFALFFQNFSTFLGRPGLYLEDLYVKPDRRGQGIGRIMLAYLARLAVERQCGRFEWWVLDWNESAIKFYRSIGAVPMDEWTVQRVCGPALEKLVGKF